MADDTKLYESMYILDVSQEEDEMRAAVDAVEAVIEEEEGEIKETLQYGRRPLAYKIGQHTEGLYIITYFEGDGEVVQALNNEFKTLETVIRGITVVANPNAIYKSERAKPSDEEAAEEAQITDEEAAVVEAAGDVEPEEVEITEPAEGDEQQAATAESEEEADTAEPAEAEETDEQADTEEDEGLQDEEQEQSQAAEETEEAAEETDEMAAEDDESADEAATDEASAEDE